MLIDPNDFALAVIVAFGLGVIICAVWFRFGSKDRDARNYLAGYLAAKDTFQQPKDNRGRFAKR